MWGFQAQESSQKALWMIQTPNWWTFEVLKTLLNHTVVKQDCENDNNRDNEHQGIYHICPLEVNDPTFQCFVSEFPIQTLYLNKNKQLE